MDEKLLKAQDMCLEKISYICRDFGLNNVMAQLYVILYFSDSPLSLDAMTERLNISKGSVSVNIRALERYGVVKRIWMKGSRKDYYEAEKNVTKVIVDRASAMVRRRLDQISDMVASAESFIDESKPSSEKDKKAVMVFKERLGQVKELKNKVSFVLTMLDSGLAGQTLGKKG